MKAMIWLYAATTNVAHAKRVLPSIVIVVVELMREGSIKRLLFEEEGCLERVNRQIIICSRYSY